jgi:hypothetical protein
MTIEAPPEMSVVMFDRFCSGRKIPLDSPLSKGDVLRGRFVPLFQKEGEGEIFEYSKRQRFMS